MVLVVNRDVVGGAMETGLSELIGNSWDKRFK